MRCKCSTFPTIAMSLLIVATISIGCSPPRIAITPPPGHESPKAINLPESMRQTNWLYSGEGSCVIASTISLLRWQNNLAAADRLRRNYGGGQTAASIQEICRRERLRFSATESSDVEFLKWCSRTRRGAIIWFYPGHCVTFCGFSTSRNGDTYAIILDNNRVKTPIRIPANAFLRDWRGYGGFALTVLGNPAPMPLYDRWNSCLLNSLMHDQSCCSRSRCSALPPAACCSAVLKPSTPTTCLIKIKTKSIKTAASMSTTTLTTKISTIPTAPVETVPIETKATESNAKASTIPIRKPLPIEPARPSSRSGPDSPAMLTRATRLDFTKRKPALIAACAVDSRPLVMGGITSLPTKATPRCSSVSSAGINPRPPSVAVT